MLTSTLSPLAEFWTERLQLLVQSVGLQLVWIIAPLAAFALLFHGIEVIVQRRLIQRFGWNA
ncbi:MAG: hypothetical protein JNK57_06465, partial [Planctomycetaceae bacterium]|nr:hypothetical protein [Planctomycetaceae bacterium]